jgi:hypothetical protein
VVLVRPVGFRLYVVTVLLLQVVRGRDVFDSMFRLPNILFYQHNANEQALSSSFSGKFAMKKFDLSSDR